MLAAKRATDLLQQQIGNAALPLCADGRKLMLRLEPNTSRRSEFNRLRWCCTNSSGGGRWCRDMRHDKPTTYDESTGNSFMP